MFTYQSGTGLLGLRFCAAHGKVPAVSSYRSQSSPRTAASGDDRVLGGDGM